MKHSPEQSLQLFRYLGGNTVGIPPDSASKRRRLFRYFVYRVAGSRAHRFLVRSKAIMLEHTQHCIAAQGVEVAATIVVDLEDEATAVQKCDNIQNKKRQRKDITWPQFFCC